MKIKSCLFLVSLLPAWFCLLANGFSIQKGGIPGIWKLMVQGTCFLSSHYFDDKDEILLKLNPDGTFRQCSERYTEGSWMSGRWNYNTDDKDKVLLVLALDRQYYGPAHDTLLEGTIADMREATNSISVGTGSHSNNNNDSCLTVVVQGNVFTGKFMYPKQHPSFFDQPLVSGNKTGSFWMKQAVATNSVMTSSQRAESETSSTASGVGGDDKPVRRQVSSPSSSSFQASDFYGRTFYLTVEPLKEPSSSSSSTSGRNKSNKNYPYPQYTKRRQSSSNRQQPEDDDGVLDIRAMPIQFFGNQTFQAFGTNKILRGRFGIQSSHDHDSSANAKLWFFVSLFGAGRSAPGSVYSEGVGLVHDDKRYYVGEILAMPDDNNDSKDGRRLFVSGSVTFGSDLGSDARPEPVGSFQLFETRDHGMKNDDDDDSDDGDIDNGEKGRPQHGLNSVFE